MIVSSWICRWFGHAWNPFTQVVRREVILENGWPERWWELASRGRRCERCGVES